MMAGHYELALSGHCSVLTLYFAFLWILIGSIGTVGLAIAHETDVNAGTVTATELTTRALNRIRIRRFACEENENEKRKKKRYHF